MMPVIDYEVLVIAKLCFLLQVAVLFVALVFGCVCLVLRCFRPTEVKRGRQFAWIAIASSAFIALWIAVYFSPSRFPNASSLLYVPLGPLAIGLLGLAWWGFVGTRPPSGLNSMLRTQVVIGLVLWVAICLPSWNQWRFMTYMAAEHEEAAGRFSRSAETATDEYYRKEFRRYAEHEAACARACRFAADHPGQPTPTVPPLD